MKILQPFLLLLTVFTSITFLPVFGSETSAGKIQTNSEIADRGNVRYRTDWNGNRVHYRSYNYYRPNVVARPYYHNNYRYGRYVTPYYYDSYYYNDPYYYDQGNGLYFRIGI